MQYANILSMRGMSIKYSITLLLLFLLRLGIGYSFSDSFSPVYTKFGRTNLFYGFLGGFICLDFRDLRKTIEYLHEFWVSSKSFGRDYLQKNKAFIDIEIDEGQFSKIERT